MCGNGTILPLANENVMVTTSRPVAVKAFQVLARIALELSDLLWFIQQLIMITYVLHQQVFGLQQGGSDGLSQSSCLFLQGHGLKHTNSTPVVRHLYQWSNSGPFAQPMQHAKDACLQMPVGLSWSHLASMSVLQEVQL